MILSAILLLVSFLMFYLIIRLGSFILIIMAIAPFMQSVNIFYGYYFLTDFFQDNFYHYSLMQDGDLPFILLNFTIYLAAIWIAGKWLLARYDTPLFRLRELTLPGMDFSMDKLVVIYCVVAMIFLISDDLNNLVSKIMRLGFYYLSFVPLLIGYFVRDLKKSTLILFGMTVLFFVGINLLVGSRGYMAVIFISITYGLLANRNNRKLLRPYLIGVFFLYVVLFPFLGFIELFRSEHGRIAYEEVDQQRLALMLREFEDKEKYEKSSESGFARNIVWPNLSVMLMTGNQVPPIGFDNIRNDLAFIFTNTFLSGKTVEEARLEYIDRLWGTGPANLYGYNVGISNSVEFSAMADGIWRYGRFGFVYHVFILVVIGLAVERLLVRYSEREQVPLWAVLIAGNVLVIYITIINGEPMISIIRALLYSSIFSLLLFVALKPFTRKTATGN